MRRVGRGREAARGEHHDRQAPVLGAGLHERIGRAQLLCAGEKLVLVHRLQLAQTGVDLAHVARRLDHVAGPGLALGADHRGSLADPAQGLAQIGRAAHERHRELPLVDVVGLVGGRQHLRLVDVVDLECLEDLGLDEVPDAGLGHDRDRDGGLDLADLGRIGHARDAALRTDVGGHALEGHDGDRAGILGHPRLLGIGDVHDDPALEHLGEAALDPHRPVFSHSGSSSIWNESIVPALRG